MADVPITYNSELYFPDESLEDYSFIGFTFNGYHSKDLGIYRTSDGSRYNELMVPNFSDTAAQVPGSDGMLYWESFYNNGQFSIPIAFDHITETQYRNLRQVFNGKVYADLIFDERPYKAYHVKVQSPPQLQTICFEDEGQRIYKGEGTIPFIAYFPFARSVHKFLNEFDTNSYPRKDEWAASSNMKEAQGEYDRTGTTIKLYNGGDVPTDWKAYYNFNNQNICPLAQINLRNTSSILTFKQITKINSNDTQIRINSATNLIEGLDSNGNPTGSLYNKFIQAGDFFQIPLAESDFVSTGADCTKIEYDYLYY